MPDNMEIAEVAMEFEDEEEFSGNLEPCLKVESINDGWDGIISNDSVTCLAVHEKFITVGTGLGRVYLLDHNGYPVQNGVYNVHCTVVNRISISEHGDYIASCGNDGRVAFYNLSDPTLNHVITLGHPITSISLAPDYVKTGTVVLGYDKVFFLTRGVFTKIKQGEMGKSKGLVTNIQWNGEFILWSDDEVC